MDSADIACIAAAASSSQQYIETQVSVAGDYSNASRTADNESRSRSEVNGGEN
jgi:hypothetical protein